MTRLARCGAVVLAALIFRATMRNMLPDWWRLLHILVGGAYDALDDLLWRGRRTYHWKARLRQLESRPCASPGTWAVVTGANSGIGFELSRILATAGVNVVLACRDPSRGIAAEEQLRSDLTHLGDKVGAVKFMLLDAGDLASVSKFAVAVSQHEVSLLVCNAGVSGTPWLLGPQGFERAFAVNHLGHALLAQLMTPRLARAAPSRIIFVSSCTAAWPSSKFRPDLFASDMSEPLEHDRFAFYGHTKATQLCYALELAGKLHASGEGGSDPKIVAHALHPGCASTDIVRAWPAAKLLAAAARLFQISPREAAGYVARLCLEEDASPAAGPGRYFHTGLPVDPGPAAGSTSNRREAWDLTQKILVGGGWVEAWNITK